MIDVACRLCYAECMIDNEHDLRCPLCKTPMVKVGNPLLEEKQLWACPRQILLVLNDYHGERPIGGHRHSGRIDVWDESRLDAWHSPA